MGEIISVFGKVVNVMADTDVLRFLRENVPSSDVSQDDSSKEVQKVATKTIADRTSVSRRTLSVIVRRRFGKVDERVMGDVQIIS